MKKTIKIGAAAGAIALAASLGLGVAPAHAVVAPAVTLGDTAGPVVDYTVSGCSVEDGATNISIYAMSYEFGATSTEVDGDAAPASGDYTGTFFSPFPTNYGIYAECVDYNGTVFQSEIIDFATTEGTFDMAGPGGADSWQIGDLTTLRTFTINGQGPFTPNSAVAIVVVGPDGQTWTMDEATADADGVVSVDRVLPYTIDGVYTVTLSGARVLPDGSEMQVSLSSSYRPVGWQDDETPAPTTPATTPDSGTRPTALPATGSEGMGLVSAAAVVTAVLGGAVVAWRSRKN